MLRKLKLALTALMMLFAGVIFSACDPGIYDFAGSGDYNPFKGMDIKQILDAEVCYNQVLEDLEFMKDSCYNNEKLAASQAYTILMSYGLADMAKESSSFTSVQLATKADLFASIKMINLYCNNFSDAAINFYNPALVLNYTEASIEYCEQMLTYFE